MVAFVTGSATSNSNNDGTPAIATGAAVSTLAGDILWLFVKHEDSAIGTPAGTIVVTDNNAGPDVVYDLKEYISHANGDLHGALYRGVQTETNPVYSVVVNLGSVKAFKNLHTCAFRPGGGETLVFDNNEANQGSSAAPATGAYAVSPGGVGDAVCFIAGYTAGTFTEGSGWTEGADPGSCYTEHRTLTVETSINGDATWASNNAWIAMSGADKSASGSSDATATSSGAAATGAVGTMEAQARPPPPYTLTRVTG